MGFFDKFVKRNTEGIAVPQYFNKTADDYEPVEGANGAMNVALTGRKVRLQKARATMTAVINSNSAASVTISPTPGYLGRLKYIGAYSPPIAGSTGSHFIVVGIGAVTYGAEQLAFTTAGGTTALTLKYESPGGIIFDSANPLLIVFQNFTNLNTDGVTARMYTVIYEEEAII
ncbi:hypothetical protein AM500_21345 [Bacillus sp. FJAT-18017]|uniref:hypothetical protein n=1 Tax=Bacillus sp. FJAT-18017 TaxID=1705566 RepID=UPI0006AE3D1E|nr:hypothetical protein [Bacillus sp. FJAT-18017]ALC92055.1 hypothetical protein AM500_21345 [Bacillus sp. FJAT-18017]